MAWNSRGSRMLQTRAKGGMSFKAHPSDLLLLARSHLPKLHSNQGMKLVKCADM